MFRYISVFVAFLLVSAAAASPPGGITVSGPGVPSAVIPQELAGWPPVTVDAAFGTDHGVLKASFTGPLLWTVLCDTRAVNPAAPRGLVREYAVITGSDGYDAVVALGEIAPMFEGKQVILADIMNGKALPPGNDRLIVPGDQRGGRSVRDVIKIAVLTAPQ
jgi:hypothetical protein